jgi:hypothetical protein
MNCPRFFVFLTLFTTPSSTMPVMQSDSVPSKDDRPGTSGDKPSQKTLTSSSRKGYHNEHETASARPGRSYRISSNDER